MYLALKHTHMTLAIISIAFFILRFVWNMMGSGMLAKKWVKISPHINDTFLLLSAFGLAFTIYDQPFSMGWVVEKIALVVVYILLGVYTLKKAQGKMQKLAGFALAMGAVFAVLSLAMSKQTFILPAVL